MATGTQGQRDMADPLTARIWQFMLAPDPAERIFWMEDLAHLGDEDALRASLLHLQREHRVGSPAPGLWFPLRRQPRDHAADRYEPFAPLRQLAVILLRRAGVQEVSSLAVTETAKAWQWLEDNPAPPPDGVPPVGVWGVPEDRLIGVDRPFALHLRWGNREYFTEFQATLMDQLLDIATPFDIKDTERFEQLAAARQINPLRLEKDLKVNHVLHLLQELDPPGCTVALTGGTALAKAYQAINRFSEDIDLHFYPRQEGPVTQEIRQQVWDYFLQFLEDRVFPQMEDSRLDRRQSRFTLGQDGQGRDTQHVYQRYGTRFASYRDDPVRPMQAPDIRGRKHPWTLRYDLTFVALENKPPTHWECTMAIPNVLEFTSPETGTWECVDLPYLAADKVDALAGFLMGRKPGDHVPGATPVSIMRHLQDLAELRRDLSYAESVQTIRDQIPWSIRAELQAGLQAWARSGEAAACFALYSKLMRPHQDPALVPMFATTLKVMQNLLRLWDENAPRDRDREPTA